MNPDIELMPKGRRDYFCCRRNQAMRHRAEHFMPDGTLHLYWNRTPRDEVSLRVDVPDAAYARYVKPGR